MLHIREKQFEIILTTHWEVKQNKVKCKTRIYDWKVDKGVCFEFVNT